MQTPVNALKRARPATRDRWPDRSAAALTLSPGAADRLRWSWHYLRRQGDSLAAVFEARLLRLRSDLASLMPGPAHSLAARERRQRLVAAVDCLLAAMLEPDGDAASAIDYLVARLRAQVDITPDRRAALRQAVQWTLRRGMGTLWTPALERDWALVLDALDAALDGTLDATLAGSGRDAGLPTAA